MASAPCKGCNDRQVGCHSTCENYQNFKKKDAEEKEALRNEKEKRFASYDFRRKQVEKAMRRHGR